MNVNYAIFRSEPIYTLPDLAQIGSHNKREKKAYKSNPDINMDLTKDNIEIVPLTDKYVKGFYNITMDYRKEHEERMKTERDDRKKTFNQMINNSKNVVADKLLFTATNTFFKDMNKADIKKWADTCMEFVYKDLGYNKEQVLHATIHMDEKTPHIHCVVIPLIKKFDKRTNTERYTISKKQYIKDKIHLSELQDKYYKRLTDNGFDLERGIKDSDNEHLNIKEYKKITRKVNNELNVKNERLNNAMRDFEEKMQTNKDLLFDKEYVKVKRDTFNSMNNVINESKKIMEIQPKIKKVFNDINSYNKSYKSLETENKNIKVEVEQLQNRNNELEEENNRLLNYIYDLLEKIKQFFRQILKVGNKEAQNEACTEVKRYYDKEDFNSNDVYDIAKQTDKENELFYCANISDCYKSRKNNKDKDDFDLSL